MKSPDFVFLFVADVSPCAGEQTHKTEWYVDACRVDCCVSLLLTREKLLMVSSFKKVRSQSSF